MFYWFASEIGKAAWKYCKDHPDVVLEECKHVLCRLKKLIKELVDWW